MNKLVINIKVRIDKDLERKLRLEASNRHLKVSNVIRDALYEYVIRRDPKFYPVKGGKNAVK